MVKVHCSHCGRDVAPSTEFRHRTGKAPTTLRAAALANDRPWFEGTQVVKRRRVEVLSDRSEPLYEAVAGGEQHPETISSAIPTSSSSSSADAAIHAAQERIWAGRQTRRAYVEDDIDEDDSGRQEHQDDEDMFEYVWGTEEYDADEYSAISAWDELSEYFLGCAATSAMDISEEDLRTLRPFALKVDTHMPGATFAKLPFAFPDSHINSWKVVQARVARLSGFTPELYDCCVNSCVCFVGPHTQLSACPHCSENRYRSNGKPRSRFLYLPLTPRLQALVGNQRSAQRMRYRAVEHQHRPGIISDVMDSSNYRTLLGQHVVVNGKQLPHLFFDDPRDIALGASTDGFAPHRRRKKTAWPLIAFNYNLPPEIRFHLEHILPLGVIPGPKKPVDFDSFLWPFVQELLRLSVGVHTYDALSAEFFALRAYLILVFGDIPAISMVMRMKGHNGYTPCRMCTIHGIRPPDVRQPTLYVPLDRTRHPSAIASNGPNTCLLYDVTNVR